MKAPPGNIAWGCSRTYITPTLLFSIFAIGLASALWTIPTEVLAEICLFCVITNPPPDLADSPPLCPKPDQDDEDADCDPPSANDGPGGDGNPNGPPCDCGM